MPDEQSHFRRDDGIQHFSGWLKLKSFSQGFDFQKVFLRIKSNECKPTPCFRAGWTCRPSATVPGHPIPTETSCMGASSGSPMERPPCPASHWLLYAERLSCYLKAPLAFFHLCWEFTLEKRHSEKEIQTTREQMLHLGHVQARAPWQPWRQPSRDWQLQWPPARADGSRPKRSWWRWSHTSVQ